MGSEKRFGAAAGSAQGFTLLELMMAVAILGILAVMAGPRMLSFVDKQHTKTSATEMAGLLADARTHALSEGTPYLVYFNAPAVDANGDCGAAAVEVKDVDHSYSITPGDQTRDFHLSADACKKVTPLGDGTTAFDSVPMPPTDLAVKAADASTVGAVATRTVAVVADTVSTVTGSVAPVTGSGSGSSGSSGDGSGSSATSSSDGSSTTGSTAARSTTVAETAVDGATFPVDAASGRPVVAFSERGVAVDPADPSVWGGGAGGIYLTDGESSVYAAVVGPLGDVKVAAFNSASGTWE